MCDTLQYMSLICRFSYRSLLVLIQFSVFAMKLSRNASTCLTSVISTPLWRRFEPFPFFLRFLRNCYITCLVNSLPSSPSRLRSCSNNPSNGLWLFSLFLLVQHANLIHTHSSAFSFSFSSKASSSPFHQTKLGISNQINCREVNHREIIFSAFICRL